MSSSSLPSLSIYDAYAPQLVAQKLNNRAAHSIECGHYPLAISSLIKALQLSEQTTHQRGCSCKDCSLESCLAFSQTATCRRVMTRKQRQYLSADDSEGYIYRQPIRVKPESTQKGHSMGPALPLIITFNLGLAHHLSAIEEECSGEMSRKKLQKVLQLYELAHRFQMEEEDEQVNCVLFTMIISNNLGEIHRVVQNHTKHVLCLEHLLSTMMFMVDCKHSSTMDDESDLLELDGFFRNTSQLSFHARCAGAA